MLDYVNAGGSLLVVGGTTSNVAVVIPTWNPFLSNFGIGFVPAVNSLVGNIDVISGTHPIFNGVSILNHDGGYNIAGVGLQVLNSDGTGVPRQLSCPVDDNYLGRLGRTNCRL